MDETMILEVCLKSPVYRFAIIVRTEDLNLNKKLRLNHGMEGLKYTKKFIFVLQQITPCQLSVIIDKNYKPVMIRQSSNRERPIHI